MTDSIYDVVVQLMGEPTSFAGLILIYLFSFLLIVFLGVLPLVVVLSILRKAFR